MRLILMETSRMTETLPKKVFHREMGEAHLIQTHLSGYVWEVEIISTKRRYRLPAKDFVDDSVMAVERTLPAIPNSRPLRRPLPKLERFRARQTVEALRFGVVPVQDIESLTLGLDRERAIMDHTLQEALENRGATLAVLADYGAGKSHFVEFIANKALQRNFIVMNASLDLLETPPAKAHEIYKALTHSVRYPEGGDDHTLTPLFKAAIREADQVHNFGEIAPRGEDCPLAVAIKAYSGCTDPEGMRTIIEWISMDKYDLPTLKSWVKRPPKLYANGDTARQYAYLLSGLSTLARIAGYAGLAVLIDESELYSQLRPNQRERADQFFQSMIYATVGDNKGRLDPDTIPDHNRVEYDISFSPTPHLVFVFAQAASPDAADQQMAVDQWLSPSQIVELNGRYQAKELLDFLKNLLIYHRTAFEYQSLEERYKPVLIHLPNLITEALRDSRLNPRQVIKLMVEVYDLLYMHPSYSAEAVMQEIRG
jgi:hypothetical protein